VTGKTHKVIGITVSLAYYFGATNAHYAPAMFGAVVIGSYFGALLPDIDQPFGDIWDSLPFGHTVAKIPGTILKHRNLSHSLFGAVVFNSLVFLVLRMFPGYWGIDIKPVLIAVVIGYLSHLLADAFTVEGIPILYPWHRNFGIPPKPFEGIRIITGAWFENLVLFPLFNIALILIIIGNWSNIKLILLK
jgi:inner membrane protein